MLSSEHSVIFIQTRIPFAIWERIESGMEHYIACTHQSFVCYRTNIFHAYALLLGDNAGKVHGDNLGNRLEYKI